MEKPILILFQALQEWLPWGVDAVISFERLIVILVSICRVLTVCPILHQLRPQHTLFFSFCPLTNGGPERQSGRAGIAFTQTNTRA